MKKLSNYIFKKKFFILKYREVFSSYSNFLFLKYDSTSSVNVNLLRNACIINNLHLYLINSKYITKFLFKYTNSTSIEWLKNDILLLPFYSIKELNLLLLNSKFNSLIDNFSILGLVINNHLLNFDQNLINDYLLNFEKNKINSHLFEFLTNIIIFINLLLQVFLLFILLLYSYINNLFLFLKEKYK